MLLLIVEDDRVCADVMAAYFRHRGACVVVARDGAEGLRIARRDRPDAVVLDVAMPRVDGIRFLEALRADPALMSTPVVVSTAVTDEGIMRRVAELGVVAYLIKGHCSLEEVFARVTAQVRSVAQVA
jgi:DNA-binding response OmpR family regulator